MNQKNLRKRQETQDRGGKERSNRSVCGRFPIVEFAW